MHNRPAAQSLHGCAGAVLFWRLRQVSTSGPHVCCRGNAPDTGKQDPVPPCILLSVAWSETFTGVALAPHAMHLLSPKRPEAGAGFFKFAALEMCELRNACYASSALQMLQKWVPNAPAVLYADKSPAYMQSWTPAKQKDLLQSMPASTAAEVILQLLLQSSHKWWYKALPRPQPRSSTTNMTTHDYVESGLEIDAEDDATTIIERPEDGLGDISDEEYDEEEVTWLTSSPVPVHVLTDSPS